MVVAITADDAVGIRQAGASPRIIIGQRHRLRVGILAETKVAFHMDAGSSESDRALRATCLLFAIFIFVQELWP